MICNQTAEPRRFTEGGTEIRGYGNGKCNWNYSARPSLQLPRALLQSSRALLQLTMKLPFPRISQLFVRGIRGSAVIATMALIMPADAQAQAQPPVTRPAPDSAQRPAPRPARRALDIRAAAPAPEVVTIRPREIPVFSRSLLVPVVIAPPPATGDHRPATVVIFPGVWPIGSADPARPPNTENRPPE